MDEVKKIEVGVVVMGTEVKVLGNVFLFEINVGHSA